MKTKTSSVSKPVTEMEYGPTGLSDGVHGELSAAPAYGDLAHGPDGTFIKMPAGYVMHLLRESEWEVRLPRVRRRGAAARQSIDRSEDRLAGGGVRHSDMK